MQGKLFLVFGDDEYLVTQSARAKLDEIVPPAEQSLGMEIIEGYRLTAGEVVKAVDACMESVQTPGFFGANKVTWLRDVNFLEARGRLVEAADTKAAVARLTEWLTAGLLAGQALVISAQKVNRVSALYKLCKKLSVVQDFGNDQPQWELERETLKRMEELIGRVGLKMSADLRREFVQRVGFDTRTIVSELEKLRLYLYPNTAVTVNDIRTICSIGSEAQAWDILDAMGKRDIFAALDTLKRMNTESASPIMLSAMLEKSARDLLILRECHARGWLLPSGNWAQNIAAEDLAFLKRLPLNPEVGSAWMIRKNLPYALNYSVEELRRARFLLLQLREKLVSSSLPGSYLLETTLLQIIGRGRGRPAAYRAATTGAR